MTNIILTLVATFILIGAESVTLLPAVQEKKFAKLGFSVVKIVAVGFLCAGCLLGFLPIG